MKKYILLISILVLAGCRTPKTDLVNSTTGEQVHCGGGSAGWWIGGPIGYHIEKNHDDRCVKKFEDQGFTATQPVKQ